VIGVVVTVAFPAYQNFSENAKAKVCATNLKVLYDALESYNLDNEAMPATLSALPAQYIREAYQRVMRQKGAWKIRLAFFAAGWEEEGIAHAGFLKDFLARGNTGVVTCPKDETPPSKGGISYGLNVNLEKMGFQQYNDLPGKTLLIGDFANDTCSSSANLEKRHRRIRALGATDYFQAITKDGTIVTEDTVVILPTIPPYTPLTTPPKTPLTGCPVHSHLCTNICFNNGNNWSGTAYLSNFACTQACINECFQ
jgi:type II secretory pathway pseudopilin PulG